MNDIENASLQKTDEKNSGIYEKFKTGGFGLAVTYWCFGVPVFLAVGISSRFITDRSNLSALMIGFLVYLGVFFIAILNAARKYKGPKFWAVIAVVIVGFAYLRNLMVLIQLRH